MLHTEKYFKKTENSWGVCKRIIYLGNNKHTSIYILKCTALLEYLEKRI